MLLLLLLSLSRKSVKFGGVIVLFGVAFYCRIEFVFAVVSGVYIVRKR